MGFQMPFVVPNVYGSTFQKILGSITRKQTEELIGAGTTKAFRMLRELCESGKLTAVGKGKISKYVLK